MTNRNQIFFTSLYKVIVDFWIIVHNLKKKKKLWINRQESTTSLVFTRTLSNSEIRQPYWSQWIQSRIIYIQWTINKLMVSIVISFYLNIFISLYISIFLSSFLSSDLSSYLTSYLASYLISYIFIFVFIYLYPSLFSITSNSTIYQSF